MKRLAPALALAALAACSACPTTVAPYAGYGSEGDWQAGVSFAFVLGAPAVAHAPGAPPLPARTTVKAVAAGGSASSSASGGTQNGSVHHSGD